MTKNWKPKEGERYWILAGYDVVIRLTWEDNNWMHKRYYTDNQAFKTKALALQALKKIKQVLHESRKE